MRNTVKISYDESASGSLIHGVIPYVEVNGVRIDRIASVEVTGQLVTIAFEAEDVKYVLPDAAP